MDQVQHVADQIRASLQIQYRLMVVGEDDFAAYGFIEVRNSPGSFSGNLYDGNIRIVMSCSSDAFRRSFPSPDQDFGVIRKGQQIVVIRRRVLRRRVLIDVCVGIAYSHKFRDVLR